jgi:hypothetical protein
VIPPAHALNLTIGLAMAARVHSGSAHRDKGLMTTPTKQELKEHLEVALAEVTAAEKSLESLLGELRAGKRAEKVTITVAVEDAFGRLRTAHSELARLRDLVSTD